MIVNTDIVFPGYGISAKRRDTQLREVLINFLYCIVEA